MAVTIPSTSVVTASMVTDWASRFSVSSDQATLDLLDIEEGRREMPDILLSVSTYAALVTRYQGVSDRLNPSQLANRKSAAAVTLSGLALAGMVVSQLLIGGNATNQTALTCYRHATTTINPQSIAGGASTSSFLTVNADANDSIRVGSLPLSWLQYSTTTGIQVAMSASGTAQIMYSNFASSSAATVDLPSADIGLDIFCHS